MNNDLFTIKKAADQVGVSTRTLKRYEEKGFVTPNRTPGDQRRYTREHVDSLIQLKNGSGLPPQQPQGEGTPPPVLASQTRTSKRRRFLLTLLLLLLLLGLGLYGMNAYDNDLNTRLSNLKKGIQAQLALLDGGKANLDSNSFAGNINIDKDLNVGQTITTKDLVVTDTGRISFLTVENGLVLSGAEGFTVVNGPVILPSGSIDNLELVNSSFSVNGGSGLTGGGLVALGGISTLNIGAGAGISVGTDDISVIYGDDANTAVQGNQSIGVTAGTNLAGGGSITLGAGGTLTLNTVSNPSFSTSVTTPLLTNTGVMSITPSGALTIGSTNQPLTLQGNASAVLTSTSGGFTSTLGFTTPTATRTVNLPDASGDICLNTGNCAGLGGTIAGSGTANRIAKFNTASTIGNSSINDLAGALAMTIDADGNVGIGDTSPASLFTVGNGDLFQVNSLGDIVKLKNLTYSWPSAHTANGVLTNNGSGTLTWGTVGASGITADSLDFTEFQDQLDLDASTDILATGSNVLSLTNTGTGNSFLVNDQASDTSPFVIDADGNVGIGTGSPSYSLQVSGTSGQFIAADMSSANPALILRNASSTSSIAFQNSSGTPLTNIFDSSGNFYVDTNGDHNFRTLSSGASRMVIKASGNVGIGTTAPGAQLQVNAGAAGTVGQIIQGAASQTADLQQWQNSSATVYGRVTAAGDTEVNNYLRLRRFGTSTNGIRISASTNDTLTNKEPCSKLSGYRIAIAS